ncbi:MAG TPA: TonB-dependent receptor, partial [Steroidobacteraceae bacterium]
HPMVGVRGELPWGWHYEVTATYGQDKSDITLTTINATALKAALASADPATALNVFSSTNPGSPGLLDSIFLTNHTQWNDSLLSGQAVLRGPLFTLPAGPVQAAFGGSWDHTKIWYEQTVDAAPTPASDLKRSEYAAFTEERVPLIAAPSPERRGEILALSLAARYDHSDDFGGKATYQGGLEWRPFNSLLLRGDYGTSYRAPQLERLYGSTLQYQLSVTDPFRGGTTYVANFPIGPSPGLNPETGRSRTLGFVYSSDFLQGLEISSTWWSIDYDNYIGNPTAQAIVSFPDQYPAGSVVRAAPTPQDLSKGWLGTILSVSGAPVNYGSLKVTGVDADASYRVPSPWGTWTPAISLTETYQYEVALTPTAPAYSVVGQANLTPGFSPRWKGSASLGWEQGALAARLTGRYISSYKDYAPYAPPDYELGDFWLFDVNLRYDIGKQFTHNPWLHDTFVSVGAVNLFNRQPQFSYYPSMGYDFQQADIRGRFIYVQAGIRL